MESGTGGNERSGLAAVRDLYTQALQLIYSPFIPLLYPSRLRLDHDCLDISRTLISWFHDLMFFIIVSAPAYTFLPTACTLSVLSLSFFPVSFHIPGVHLAIITRIIP